MKIWSENEIDAFSYYSWFNKDDVHSLVDNIPNLRVSSINSTGLFGSSYRTAFIDYCNNYIREVFAEQEFANDYKLYLFINIEIKNRNSRIEKYKRVWKLLQEKWQIKEFKKGPEIEVAIKEKVFFSAIAEAGFESVLTALEIVASNPKNYTVIVSKKDNILSEEAVENWFKVAFNQYSRVDGIDYFGLSLNLCPEGDIVFRWGDSAEEAELALIYDSRHFNSMKL
jgi:hypothetical protein